MKDAFHLLDLISQAVAVRNLLEGKSAAEKLAWLSEHCNISQIAKKMPECPDTYFFESTTGQKCGFTSQGDIFRIERFKKYCSHSAKGIGRAVFLVFGVVSAQLQGFSTCSFAEASPKTKNPRSEMATVFFKPL